ncbi:MAG: hypothetical protein KAH23_08910 [Kiritimatiellae bacterium]|nr:hypothetical protein [Kiritimatiellia bacterium]
MKKILLVILIVASLAVLQACFLPVAIGDGALVVTIIEDAQRPPFTVRMELGLDRPGVYLWYGPWGMDSTTDQNWYEAVVTEFSNPMMFDAEWTNGVDIIDPEPQFITFDNNAPRIVREPKFSTASAFNTFAGNGIYLRDLQPGQFYVIDFRDCAIDPDGDKVSLIGLEFITFHKTGYVPPQFSDAFPDILAQWVDDDYVDEGPTPYFVTPVDNNKLQWNSVEGLVGYQPRWPEIIPDGGNGLPYAPFRFQTFSQYPVYNPACDQRLFDQDTLPTGGIVIRALYSDGSLEVWGEWVRLVGPTIGCS